MQRHHAVLLQHMRHQPIRFRKPVLIHQPVADQHTLRGHQPAFHGLIIRHIEPRLRHIPQPSSLREHGVRFHLQPKSVHGRRIPPQG